MFDQEAFSCAVQNILGKSFTLDIKVTGEGTVHKL
jgi:hypothetical protein